MNTYWSNIIKSIKVNQLPTTCWDCPFWKAHTAGDDTGHYNCCPFGCTHIDSALHRVDGCPLEVEE